MAKYKVTARAIVEQEYEVEAETCSEAEDLAEEMIVEGVHNGSIDFSGDCYTDSDFAERI